MRVGFSSGVSSKVVTIISTAAIKMLDAVRATESLSPGASQLCRCRARNAPTSVPAVLKMMSLNAGSLPGMTTCANSTVVATRNPQSAAVPVERKPNPITSPSGKNRKRMRIPSASPRRPNVKANENCEGGPLPDGVSVTTSMASSTMAITTRRTQRLTGMAILIVDDERYVGGAYTGEFRGDWESVGTQGAGLSIGVTV